MRKFREISSRGQIALLPRSVEEFVGSEDMVRYVDLVVDELDLSGIENQYSTFGRPGYSPRVLSKILLFGKMRGMRSSRELSRACRENLRFIFLASDERPDFRTISEFRKRFHRELSHLLKQTIEIGVREDIIKLEHVSIDGTKIGASASRKSFKKPNHLREQLEALEKELEDTFAKDIAVDEEDDDHFGDNDDGDGKLLDNLKEKEVLRSKIKNALNHYDDIEGEQPKKISITDPESRYMRSKGTNPSYTGLAAVDSESRMVVGGYANNSVSDNAELLPSLEEIECNTGKNPVVVTADKAFRAHEGLRELEKRGIDGYVPMPDESEKRFTFSDFKPDLESGSYICPNNKILRYVSVNRSKDSKVYRCDDCAGCPIIDKCMPNGGKHRTLNVSNSIELVQEMKRKTLSPTGIEMAKKRSSLIEPLFGYLKASKKLRQFLFRGMNMINSMWKLELASYNIEKLAKFRQLQKAECFA